MLFPFLPSLNYFHHEGSFSELFETFESRTRIPREAILYSSLIMVATISVCIALWNDVRLLWWCGIILGVAVPLPLFLKDLSR